MKFAIVVLLGLCALAANAQFLEEDFEPQNNITDKIRAKIEEIMKKVTDEFSAIAEKISAIARKIREEAREMIMKGKEKIEHARDQIMNKIDELKKKGGVYKECAKKYEPEYRQIEKDTMAELKKCAGEVMVSKEEQREESDKAVAAIRAKLREIRDMVSDCLGWNPISATKCIFEKTSELKKLVDEVITASREALRISRERASNILSKAKECNRKVLSDASNKVREVNNKMAECFKGSEFFLY